MNWELVKKDKNGEIQVNFFWICVLIVFIGFLFGFGFSLAYFVINYVFGNDGYYFYFFIKTYWIGLFLLFILFCVYKLKKENI